MKDLKKQEIEELFNISENQPVFAGKLISHQTGQSLVDKGLALRYEGEYCLTEKGKEVVLEIKMEGALIIKNQGILYPLAPGCKVYVMRKIGKNGTSVKTSGIIERKSETIFRNGKPSFKVKFDGTNDFYYYNEDQITKQ